MKFLPIAIMLLVGGATQCASLVENQSSQFGGGDYQRMSLGGVQQYCAEVLDASRASDTARLEAVNRSYGVLAQPDGSLRFPCLNPAVVENTVPTVRMAVKDSIRGACKTLKLGNSVNQPSGSYAVTAACGNSLFWLAVAVEPRTIQRTTPMEIDPNPMNSLPPGWEKSIKKAEINTTRADWRAALSGFDPH